MEYTDARTDSYADDYNALPSVEAAYARLKALPDADSLIDKLLKVIALQNDRASDVGVFLLHRHFTCPADQTMLEARAEDSSQKPMWITSAQRMPAGIRIAPSRVAFDAAKPGRLRPLEYSTDPVVCETYDKIIGNHALLSNVRAALVESGVIDLLGVVIGLPTVGEDVLHEVTDGAKAQSVVTLSRKSEITKGSIPTIWSRRHDTPNGCCTVVGNCFAYCMRPGDWDHVYGHISKGGPNEHIGCA